MAIILGHFATQYSASAGERENCWRRFDLKKRASYDLSLTSGPSEFLQAFLHNSISSYEELEALLLLVRRSDRSWTDGELAKALKVQVEGITPALDKLVAVGGLLEVNHQAAQRRIRYAPKSKLLRQVVEELAVVYVEQRLAIVQLMSTNALDRVRVSAMHRLADAFRIGRLKK